MGLKGIQEIADSTVEVVAGHDVRAKKIQQGMEERERCWDEDGLTYEEWLERIVAEEADPPADSISAVYARWVLE